MGVQWPRQELVEVEDRAIPGGHLSLDDPHRALSRFAQSVRSGSLQTMTHCIAVSVPICRNPALRPGLAALVSWLQDQRYSSHAIGRIENYVAVHGTPAGIMIEPQDEAPADEAFAEGLDAVPGDSDA
jgi:hypothetical protein